MARFRRRSRPAEASADDQAVASPDPGTAEQGVEESERPEGPFDDADTAGADDSLTRLDLGSLLIPGLPGIGIQVEADPETQEVRAVTGVGDQAAVQLQAFAAPRSEGVWDEIRAEMLAELGRAPGAEVTEHVGSFGPELHAVLPAQTADGTKVQQPVRFVGIDGPRWFLRVVFLGRAAVAPDPSDALHELVRQTIVVRGGDAMAPRDPLPLALPADAVAEPGSDDEDDAAHAELDPFERGPEITETR